MALPATVAVGAPITSTDHNALIPQRLILREEQLSGTSAGGVTGATWTKRNLNIVALNEIAGASLASNVITLPAGVYQVTATAPAYVVSGHKIRLRQTSGTAADLLYGSTEIALAASTVQTISVITDQRITLSGSTTLELQHWVTTTRATDGLGHAATTGVTETYSQITITKVG